MNCEPEKSYVYKEWYFLIEKHKRNDLSYSAKRPEWKRKMGTDVKFYWSAQLIHCNLRMQREVSVIHLFKSTKISLLKIIIDLLTLSLLTA